MGSLFVCSSGNSAETMVTNYEVADSSPTNEAQKKTCRPGKDYEVKFYNAKIEAEAKAAKAATDLTQVTQEKETVQKQLVTATRALELKTGIENKDIIVDTLFKNIPTIITLSMMHSMSSKLEIPTFVKSFGAVEGTAIPAVKFLGGSVSQGLKRTGPVAAVVSAAWTYNEEKVYKQKNIISADQFNYDVATSAIKGGLTAVVATAFGSAVAGACVGSVAPGVGTVLGFGAGLAMGLLVAYELDQASESIGKSLIDDYKTKDEMETAMANS